MRRTTTAALGLSLGLLGCTTTPAEVVIDTRVGQPQIGARRQTTPADVIDRLALYGEIGRSWWQGKGAPIDESDDDDDDDGDGGTKARDQAPEISFVARPPTEPEAFAALMQAVREGPIDEIGVPLHNLAEAGPNLWPQVRAELLAERKRSKREYRQVLAVIGGDVPNRYGYFELHWKKAHGYDVRLSEDWFEDLLAVAPGRITKPLRPVYRDTLLTAALLRAAGDIGRRDPRLTAEVVTGLLDAAYVHEGTFRDEVGRAVDAVGDPAIPTLLRESLIPDDGKLDEDSVPARRAEYARYCLDRMDRLHPQRAIEALADDRRMLADVLAAYGVVRDGEAAPLVLAYVDADQPGIRAAARAAFEAYVVGPLPSSRRKSVRLLDGSTTERKAELSYREHARLAIRDTLTARAPELLEDECALHLPGGLIDHACEGQPERLYRAYLGWLDQRRAARRQRLIGEALVSADRQVGATVLDGLLTDGSALGPEAATVFAPYYVEVAADSDDPARAAQLLRKSATLLADADPERARDLTVDALVLEASAPGVDPRGREMLLSTAAELEPEAPAVLDALAEIADERAAIGSNLRTRLSLYALGLFAVLSLLWLIGARRAVARVQT